MYARPKDKTITIKLEKVMFKIANSLSNKMVWNIVVVHHLLKKEKDYVVQQKLINKAI